MKPTRQHFEALALEQLDTLYRMARRLTHNTARADDLVQETYLRAVRSAESFDLQDYGIRPWLLRIMHNLWTTGAQRESRQPRAMQDDLLQDAAGAFGAEDHLPIDPGSFDAMDENLVHALEHLPPEYRSVMLLWAVEELSYKEIAVALEIPVGTVMSRLHRARARLMAELGGGRKRSDSAAE